MEVDQSHCHANKDPTDDCAVALVWTPEGSRKRRHPKT